MEKTNPDKSNSIASRFIKGRRQDAMTEIEGWIAGNRADTFKAGAARMSSQPAKNVTEQKMLDSKLFDMSKQRFNFILHCQWQRKLFLEKQRRKTVVMRDLLRNVDVTIFSENPFVTEKSKNRQGTVLPSQRKKDLKSRLATSATLSLQRQSPTSTQDATFVTKRTKFLPQIVQPLKATSNTGFDNKLAGGFTKNFQHEAASQSGSVLSKKAWPMCDVRYVRLSAVLCDNYPKVKHLRAHTKNALLSATAAY